MAARGLRLLPTPLHNLFPKRCAPAFAAAAVCMGGPDSLCGQRALASSLLCWPLHDRCTYRRAVLFVNALTVTIRATTRYNMRRGNGQSRPSDLKGRTALGAQPTPLHAGRAGGGGMFKVRALLPLMHAVHRGCSHWCCTRSSAAPVVGRSPVGPPYLILKIIHVGVLRSSWPAAGGQAALRRPICDGLAVPCAHHTLACPAGPCLRSSLGNCTPVWRTGRLDYFSICALC